MENPLEFGIVITDDDGRIERFLEKPTWGQVFCDTINTGIYVLEPEVFDYIAAGPAGRLLRARCSRRCSRPGGRSTAGSPSRYWEDVGNARGLPERAPRHPRLARSRSTSPASRSGPASGSARAPRSTRRPRSTARRSSATTAASAPGRGSAPYCVLGANVRVGDNADLERTVVHDNCYLGAGVDRPRLGDRPLVRPPPGGAPRGGRRARRRVPRSAAGAVIGAGREGLPAQDRRGGRDRQLLDHLGVPRLASAVRPRSG